MSDDKLDKILQSFSKLEANVNAKFLDLESKISKVQQQVDTALLPKMDSSQTSDHVDQGDQPAEGQARLNVTAQPQLSAPTQGFHQVDSDALQWCFKAIKDSYVSVCLLDDLYFSAQQQGIDNKFRDSANILSGVAKYSEATLKVIGHLSQNMDDESQQEVVNDLMVCMVSQMRYIQERHASLVVVGTYGSRAKQLFDSMGGATSSFAHPQILQRVETATKPASYQPQEERDFGDRQPFRRGRGQWRGRGVLRGGFRGCGMDAQPFQTSHFPQDRDRDELTN